MKSKSLKAVFFFLIFLTSKIGLALNVHYCGGHIEKIALAWNAQGCVMASSKKSDASKDVLVKKNHCCQDETILIQNNEPQKFSDIISKTQWISVLEFQRKFFVPLENYFSTKILTPPKDLLPKQKIYLLHRSLLFYA